MPLLDIVYAPSRWGLRVRSAQVGVPADGQFGHRVGRRSRHGCSLSGDPQALTRAVRNLIDNAVTHARSTVTLTISATDDTADLIIDDGPGMPPADRSRIFDRFVRLEDDRARSSGGTGLGLAIVTEIVAAHHGSVQVGESSLGGARFSVSLPLRA
ncbi:sensor histidine kinase [Nocardia sp. NPDC004123]